MLSFIKQIFRELFFDEHPDLDDLCPDGFTIVNDGYDPSWSLTKSCGLTPKSNNEESEVILILAEYPIPQLPSCRLIKYVPLKKKLLKSYTH